MPTRIPRMTYADMYGPTTGDRVRLGRGAQGVTNGCKGGWRGIEAKPPHHRRAAPRHVDLVGLGALFDLRADVAGIKRLRSTVGSTHRGPSMARGALPPATPEPTRNNS